jgi:hypothetical protein
VPSSHGGFLQKVQQKIAYITWSFSWHYCYYHCY